MRRAAGRVALTFAAMSGLWLAWLVWNIVDCGATRADPPRADVALVLGASAPGGVPSPVFAARIDHAIALLSSGRVGAILFTGGRAEGRSMADSEAARIYALAKGAPAGAILIETASRTTRENITEARRIMDRRGLSTCLVVSDPAHLFRAGLMLKASGLTGWPAPTPVSRIRTPWARCKFVMRELWLCHVYLLFGQ